MGERMKPKKRDRETDEAQIETLEADHELFLQAFEKPTQIYRYLRTRNVVLPIFLQRSLWYMKHRRSVSSKKRKTFKVDTLLTQVEVKRRKASQSSSYKSEFLNLEFKGISHPGFPNNTDTAEVEVLLLKFCHKKRKDVSSPVTHVSLGKVNISVNSDVPSPQRTITVNPDIFSQTNGHTVRSYVLLFKVAFPSGCLILHGLCNGDIHDPEEPPHKRRKNGRTWMTDGENVLYSAELVMYDRHKHCQLVEGEYEVGLENLRDKSNSKRRSWETMGGGKEVGPFDVFNQCASLKFSLCWTDTSLDTSPRTAITLAEDEFRNNNQLANHILDVTNNNSGSPKKESPAKLKDVSSQPVKKNRIFYQFMYNKNTRQQTEARHDLRCPWCSINCMQLFSLLKHLRLYHARFEFLYVPHPKGIEIDVSINERYDGSYVGNPQDLHSHIGFAFSRKGPVRRTPVTHILVYRPKRPEPSLAEFLEPENESKINRQFVQGHNRLYYRTATSNPMRPQEIDYDSDSENDPLWLRQKTVNMIEEFTDVNEGEKELMKLWNLHIMKKNLIGDVQIPVACSTFVELHGREIIEKNLCRNFILHMVNLFDFSLIRPEVVQRTIGQIECLKEEMGVY
ncbi:polycomb protein suz12-like [Gigantopelta aegis]|uniref:polycomb protein suz12-like n=1 Tax=Gigantopelta aegis TaxID=1735272 RepID=UPI001B88A0A5|nr:polycomb protein suz12-like [Gigantopelta aegis]